MRRNGFLRGFIALAITALLTPLCYADKRPVKLTQQRNGSVMDERLMNDGPTYITTAEELEKLWKDWKIRGKKPKLNFSKQIVVVVTSRGSGLGLVVTLDEKGDLAVYGLGTMDIRPGFRYMIATVSRTGVKTVNGKDLSTPIKGPNSGQNSATVTGTVTYRQRVAMPPGAVVEVSLLDVSRADAPAVVLDKLEVKPTTQVPIPFTLSYDPAQIDERHTYAVQARILVKGRLWFINATRHSVITQGNPTKLEVLVDMVKSGDEPAAQEPGSQIVKTQAGDVLGVVERNVFAFKGIPYASPPVGDLRWREPQPAAIWQGVRKVHAYGNACIQQPGVAAAIAGDPSQLSEDCLYLNIWTPRPDLSAGLPVMVWIHGGAFIVGSGAAPGYNGGSLAKKGAVVVTINYRLGQLGFFAHPALEKEHPGGPANFGLLDQIAALKWVQQNIAQFGGDPNNVTIFGESSGGQSILALFASPLARGLFHKGIVESSYAIPDATRAKALEVGSNVADAVGLRGANATVAELRAVPAEKFGQLKGQKLSHAPVPISGDKVLPQSIQETFAAGKEAPLPLILGSNSDEPTVATAFGVDPAEVIKNLRGASIFVRALYPGVKDDSELGRQAVRDLIFTMPVRWLADRHSKLAPSWRYYFDYIAVKERANFPNGVPHGGEIVYAMDTGDIFPGTKDIFTDEDREFARRVSDYWFEFARTGRPSSQGNPEWPNDTGRQDKTMLFGEKIEVQTNFMKTRLNIFIGVTKILGRVLNRK